MGRGEVVFFFYRNERDFFSIAVVYGGTENVSTAGDVRYFPFVLLGFQMTQSVGLSVEE